MFSVITHSTASLSVTSEWLFTYAPIVALGVSLLALATSSLSLGWNIYRDVVLKPRLKVRFGIKSIVRPGDEHMPTQTSPPLLVVDATNHGPGDVVCREAIVRKHSGILTIFLAIFRRFPYNFIMPDWENPYCTRLPSRVAIGDSVSVIFPHDRECFLSEKANRIGIADSFGRVHWAQRKDLKRARRQYAKDSSSLIPPRLDKA